MIWRTRYLEGAPGLTFRWKETKSSLGDTFAWRARDGIHFEQSEIETEGDFVL